MGNIFGSCIFCRNEPLHVKKGMPVYDIVENDITIEEVDDIREILFRESE